MPITKRIQSVETADDHREFRGPNAGGGGPRKPSTPATKKSVTKITDATKKALAKEIITEVKRLKNYNNYASLAKGARKLAELWEKRAALNPEAEAQKCWKQVWSEFLASAKKGYLDSYVDSNGVLNCTDSDELSNYMGEVVESMDEYDGDFLQEAHDFLRDYG